MSRAFQFQDPGEGIREAEVQEVLVGEGDHVEEGQVVLLVETDKAVFEVSAAFAGRVDEVDVEEGATIHVGDTLLRIAEEGGDDATDEARSHEAEPAEEEGAQAAESNGSAQQQSGTAESREEAGQHAVRPRRDEPEGSDRPVPAAPSTRRVARELDVDLREVEPSGEAGRVLTEDVRAYAEGAAEPQTEGGRREPALPDLERWGPVERVPLRSVRRTIARRMARAWSEVPHVTHGDELDVTGLERFRARRAPEVEERGGRLTWTVLAMKAAGAALREHPRFNAALDAAREELVLRRSIHVGFAVDTERGLLVPVVRDVDRKGLVELAVELRELAGRARAGELTREELSGATFTITNVGALGGTHFTPLVDWPQVAILGLGRGALRPVVRGDLDEHELVPRYLLPVSLGFDHRVNDGADAARFVASLGRALADVESFALAV